MKDGIAYCQMWLIISLHRKLMFFAKFQKSSSQKETSKRTESTTERMKQEQLPDREEVAPLQKKLTHD